MSDVPDDFEDGGGESPQAASSRSKERGDSLDRFERELQDKSAKQGSAVRGCPLFIGYLPLTTIPFFNPAKA
jgi:hypothetical protein